MIRKKLSLAVVAALVSPTFTSYVARAQDAGASSGRLEEIVVTAEFRRTNLQDTPIAVTAVNAEMLEQRGQYNVIQIAAQAPNVQLTSAAQNGGSAMFAFIRGVGQTDFHFALEPGVGMYVDDVYFPTLSGSMFDLVDVDRVEVLRGPQGTLAGRNSIGGAIKIFSREPKLTGDDVSGDAELSFGDYDRVGVRGAADLRFVDGKLAARVAGVSRSREGYVQRLDWRCMNPSSTIPSFNSGDLKNCQTGTLGGESFTGGRVSLVWEPTDNFKLKFIGDTVNTNSDPGPQVLLSVDNPVFLTNGYGQGTFIDVDGNSATTADRVYFSNAFVPYGSGRPANAVVNDPYVSYASFIDPNQPLPTRPFSPGAADPKSKLNEDGASVQLSWNIKEKLALTWISSVRKYDDIFAADLDGSPIQLVLVTQAQRHKDTTNEVRLTGTTLKDRLDYTIGYFNVDQSEATHEGNVNLFDTQLNFVDDRASVPSKSKALFVHTNWHLTDKLNLTVGARASHDEKDYTYRSRNPDGTLPTPCTTGNPNALVNSPNCAIAGLWNVFEHFEKSKTDYRVALDYHVSDGLMLYGQVATGYKGGGINPRPYFLVQIETFNPEELKEVELGAKLTLANGRIRLNSAIFKNDYTDIQLTQNQCELPFPPFFGRPCSQPGNVGDAKSSGVEIEMEAHPTDKLSLDVTLGLLDFDYVRTEPSTAVRVGMITPFTPKRTNSVGIQYDFPLNAGGGISVRLDRSWKDDIYSSAINSPANLIKAYALTNARLAWRSAKRDWQAALEVSNLANKLYYTTVSESTGYLGANVGPPRMWVMSLKRSFDF